MLHTAEDSQLLLFGAPGISGIVDPPMMTVQLTGKYRTGLIGKLHPHTHSREMSGQSIDDQQPILRKNHGATRRIYQAHRFRESGCGKRWGELSKAVLPAIVRGHDGIQL
jgi:hypothetical protein